MDTFQFFYVIIAMLAAFLLSFLITPAVRVLAYKIGAIDVPKDERRMHNKPMPLIGGLAIFLSFSIVTLIFFDVSKDILTLWAGGLVLVILGIFDDIYDINAWIKLSVQIIVALIAIHFDVVIKSIYIFGKQIEFGWLSYPITIFWIIALINAFNLIDGLDGLSCGVCSICCLSMFIIAILMHNPHCALLAAVLFGSCCGFLPHNFNPAKIFMGDTGAYFLGFVLAIISIEGLFKISTVISFILPMIVFALPLFDTSFAFCRRILNGQGPFTADKRHLHHRLIAFGLSQRQAVLVLYVISALFGLIAIIYTDILFSENKLYKAAILLIAAILICVVDFMLMSHENTREHFGFSGKDPENNKKIPEKTDSTSEKNEK